jgi:hypothetical protein
MIAWWGGASRGGGPSGRLPPAGKTVKPDTSIVCGPFHPSSRSHPRKLNSHLCYARHRARETERFMAPLAARDAAKRGNPQPAESESSVSEALRAATEPTPNY